MTKRHIIMFFTIVLSLYGLMNFYIYRSGLAAIPSDSPLSHIYWVTFLFLVLAFPLGRIMERFVLFPLSSFLVWVGSFWLAAMVYLLFAAIIVDMARVINLAIPILPRLDEEIRLIVGGTIGVSVLVVVIAGHLNAVHPRIKMLNLTIPKNGQAMKSVRFAVASDIHLGTIVCKARLERIVEKINALDADIVLLPGDVVDEDIGPVIRQNLGEVLRTIQSRHGVYAVTGNHEYIGGVEAACAYLIEHGITMLRDQSVKIHESLYIVGREDVSYNRPGRKRKPLSELLAGIDAQLPIIMMDHQPFRLHEAEEHGIDVQLSGHTHHGQLWPFSYLTRRIFEVSWGYKKKGNTHVYVSSGVGSWGPPVRTGNRPEIIDLNIQFA